MLCTKCEYDVTYISIKRKSLKSSSTQWNRKWGCLLRVRWWGSGWLGVKTTGHSCVVAKRPAAQYLTPCRAQLWLNSLTFLMWPGNITRPCWFSYDVGSLRYVVGRWVGGQEQPNPVVLVEAELSVWAWRPARPEGTSWVENEIECLHEGKEQAQWERGLGPWGRDISQMGLSEKLHLTWCFRGKTGPCSYSVRGCF